jgi:hypothetical protein
MTDAFGTPLLTENRIAWASRKGSKMWLSYGVVKNTDDKTTTVLRLAPTPVRFIRLRVRETIVRIL